MSDETTVAESEVEETIEPSNEQDTEDNETADSASEDDAGDDETEEDGEADDEYEFDFGGNPFRVSKKGITPELAEKVQGFVKGVWSNYTTRSEGVANATRELQAREQTVQKMTQLQGEALDAYSRGLALRQEIEQLSRANDPALWQTDPDRARMISDQISAKTSQFNSMVALVSRAEQAMDQTQAVETARRSEEGKRFIETRVKGFSGKVGEVIDYVNSAYGIPKHEAETWPMNPAAAEMAYKAMMWDKLQKETKKKTSPKVEKVEVKPNRPFKSKSGGANKDPDKMSPDEWLRWRNNQLAKKGGR